MTWTHLKRVLTTDLDPETPQAGSSPWFEAMSTIWFQQQMAISIPLASDVQPMHKKKMKKL